MAYSILIEKSGVPIRLGTGGLFEDDPELSLLFLTDVEFIELLDGIEKLTVWSLF